MGIRLGRLLGVLFVVFFFAKIYQHNRVIQVSYQRQRIEREKRMLAAKVDALAMRLALMRDRNALRIQATQKHNMTSVSLSQVFTTSSLYNQVAAPQALVRKE